MTDTTTISDLFTQWDIPWIVTSELALAAVLYTRGWVRIHRTRPAQFPAWRLASFLGGVLALFVAVASPLDTFSESLLFMHMGQHFVLMSIAPPLLIFGAPVVPMLRGLPKWTVRLLRPLFVTRALPAAGRFLTDPRVAWLAMATAYISWHIPSAYEFALSSENWHNFEHACFFFTNLMFWWPVIRPWPFRGARLGWMLDSVSAPRRRGQYRHLRIPLLFRVLALSQLRRSSATLWPGPPQRSSRGRRLHVGLRHHGVPCSRGFGDDALPFAHSGQGERERPAQSRGTIRAPLEPGPTGHDRKFIRINLIFHRR